MLWSILGWASCCMPCDFSRQLTGLDDALHWKMHSARNFFLYLAYPLMMTFSSSIKEGQFFLHQVKELVQGLRILCGFSSQPLLPHRVHEAKVLFRNYITGMKDKFGPSYMSFVHHLFVHLYEDCLFFNCPLDRNSANDFETFHQAYARLIQRGPAAHIQLL